MGKRDGLAAWEALLQEEREQERERERERKERDA